MYRALEYMRFSRAMRPLGVMLGVLYSTDRAPLIFRYDSS